MLRDKKNLSAGDLIKLFQAASIGPANCAHLAIDIQKCFAIKETARHIANNITPAFRKHSIPNYWVHLSDHVDENNIPIGVDAFCEVSPLPEEKVVRKTTASAFKGSNIDKLLKEKNIKLVVITGFAFNCCVKATAEDAIKNNYNVVILTDGVEQYGPAKFELAAKGATFANSNEFIKAIQHKITA